MFTSLLCSGLQLIGGGVCWWQQMDAAVRQEGGGSAGTGPSTTEPGDISTEPGLQHTRESLFKVSSVSLMSVQTLNTDHKSCICILFLCAVTLILHVYLL